MYIFRLNVLHIILGIFIRILKEQSQRNSVAKGDTLQQIINVKISFSNQLLTTLH